MYMKRMLEIGQASNGFVIECRVPIKRAEKKNNKEMIDSYPGSCEKQYIAKDTKEVSEIIGKLMPMLDDKFTSEEEFDMAFNKAAGVKDED
jgi:hypothetical protein